MIHVVQLEFERMFRCVAVALAPLALLTAGRFHEVCRTFIIAQEKFAGEGSAARKRIRNTFDRNELNRQTRRTEMGKIRDLKMQNATTIPTKLERADRKLTRVEKGEFGSDANACIPNDV